MLKQRRKLRKIRQILATFSEFLKVEELKRDTTGLFNSIQNTSVSEVLRRLNVLGSNKMYLKNIVYTTVRWSIELINKLRSQK